LYFLAISCISSLLITIQTPWLNSRKDRFKPFQHNH
jgi:hypothetical protein